MIKNLSTVIVGALCFIAGFETSKILTGVLQHLALDSNDPEAIEIMEEYRILGSLLEEKLS